VRCTSPSATSPDSAVPHGAGVAVRHDPTLPMPHGLMRVQASMA
jgi:hypothetical protein